MYKKYTCSCKLRSGAVLEPRKKLLRAKKHKLKKYVAKICGFQIVSATLFMSYYEIA